MKAKFVTEGLNLLKSKSPTDVYADVENASPLQLYKSVHDIEDEDVQNAIRKKLEDVNMLKIALLDSETENKKYKQNNWDFFVKDNPFIQKALGTENEEDFLKADILGFDLENKVEEWDVDYNFFDQFIKKVDIIAPSNGSRVPGVSWIYLTDGSKALFYTGYNPGYIARKEWIK